MKKLFFTLSTIFVLANITTATEPATTWIHQVQIKSIYVGDYNVSGGSGYIESTDGQLYLWSTSTPFGRLMYATALTAKSMVKRVNVLRSNTPYPNTTNYWTIYRIQLVD